MLTVSRISVADISLCREKYFLLLILTLLLLLINRLVQYWVRSSLLTIGIKTLFNVELERFLN